MPSPELRSENWALQPELYEKFQAGVLGLLESENWRAYLAYQRRFHRYSPGNALLVMLQNPDASQIGSMQTWNRQGRSVKPGEHGLKIWCPVPGKPSVELDEDGEEREVKGRTFFKLGTVFDVEQTKSRTGQAPPEVVRVIDQALRPNLLATLEMVAADRGITLKESPKKEMHGANGFFTPADNTITMLDSLPSAQRAKTLAHELGHSILHGDGYDYLANRPDAELEAESVAYLVCGSMGLDSKDYSFGYVAGWASELGEKGREEVAERLLKATKSIRAASEEIVQAVEAKLGPADPVREPASKLTRVVESSMKRKGVAQAHSLARERASATAPPNAVDVLSPALMNAR